MKNSRLFERYRVFVFAKYWQLSEFADVDRDEEQARSIPGQQDFECRQPLANLLHVALHWSSLSELENVAQRFGGSAAYMAYYLRTVPGHPWQTWKIEDGEAQRLGVGDAKEGIGTYFKAGPDETIWEVMKRDASGFFGPKGESPFEEITLGRGQFYPRIGRPWDWSPLEGLGWNKSALDEPIVVATALGQLSVLTRQLQRICQTVHPEGAGLEAYGHDIRNLLILACTEVEAHWRGILIANGVTAKCLNTKKYVELSDVLKLRDYAVEFFPYPWLPPFTPFRAWGTSAFPTKDIPWYEAYNAVKHDREGSFHRGSLRHVFDAIAAIAIMIAAQFGLSASGFGKSQELFTLFRFTAKPKWPCSDLYIRLYDEAETWRALSYPF